MKTLFTLFLMLSLLFLLSSSTLLQKKHSLSINNNHLQNLQSALPLKNAFTNEYPELASDFGTFDLPNYPKRSKHQNNSLKPDKTTTKLIHKLIRQSMKQNIQTLKKRKLMTPSNHKNPYSSKTAIKTSNLKTLANHNGLDFSNFMKNMAPISQRKLKQAKIVNSQIKKTSKLVEKSKNNKRKLQEGSPTLDNGSNYLKANGSLKNYFRKHFVPEKLGVAFLSAGAATKEIKTYLHNNDMDKLNKIGKKQLQRNVHTRKNDHLLFRLSHALKRTSDQLEQMREIADERLSSKIDQIRNY